MLQEIHKTGWLVWTFTQDAFAKSYISSYDSSTLMFSHGNTTEYGENYNKHFEIFAVKSIKDGN